MKIKLPKLVINLSFGLLVCFSLLFLPASLALAADAIKFTPQIPIPGMGSGAIDVGTTNDGKMTSDLLARYIKAMYDYGLKAAGILAAVILMGGGLIWLTSAGNESKIGQAKEMIVGAISGLVILFSAWLILNTVNPELLKLTPISLTNIDIAYGCCDKATASGKAEMTSKQKCETGSGFSKTKQLNASGVCEDQACCVITEISTNNDYETNSIDICANTLSQTCTRIAKAKNINSPIYTTYTSEVKPGSCSEVPRCTKQIVNCSGKKDAFSGDLGNNQEYWCYGEVFYFGKGDIGEPCGNEPYSKCTTEYFSNANDYFGRSCCGPLTPGCTTGFCNKFKADGTKKYDSDIQN